MKRTKTICFTGHRTLPTGVAFEILKKQLLTEIQVAIQNGYRVFLFGAAMGFDMLVGEVILEYQKLLPTEVATEIELVAVVPFAGQSDLYPLNEKVRYENCLKQCSKVVVLQETFSTSCYKARNQYMVDQSTALIAYYNGKFRSGTGQTLRMALRKNLTVYNLYESYGKLQK